MAFRSMFGHTKNTHRSKTTKCWIWLQILPHWLHWISSNSVRTACRDDEGDEGTQATNINELFDFALELLWSLVTKNGWDQTKLPDISEGFSYVSNCKYWNETQSERQKPKVNASVDLNDFCVKRSDKKQNASRLKRDKKITMRCWCFWKMAWNFV